LFSTFAYLCECGGDDFVALLNAFLNRKRADGEQAR
jgi:hypothetical protein